MLLSSGRLPAVFIAFCLVSCLIALVQAKGEFGLRIDNFLDVINNNRKEYCYDRITVLASKPCQKTVRLFLLGGVQSPTSNSELKLGQANFSLSRLPAEANITIDGALPTSFTLVAELYQSTAANSEVLVARFVFNRGSATPSEDWLSVGSIAPSNTTGLAAEALRITVAYRVRCSRFFYGPTCLVFCESRDDPFGHYTCLPSGERQCLPGWTAANRYCDRPLCPGCHAKGGKCEAPNRCRCQVGWHGKNCSECQRYAGCDHGYCVEPNECRCNAGWLGRFCNHEQSVCRKSPCLNGATCIDNNDVENATRYECKCARGFIGTRCEQRVTSVRPTSTTTTSTQAASRSPNLCATGDTQCAQQEARSSVQTTTKSHACSSLPCRNGATCVLTSSNSDANDAFMCVCRPGYTGTLCELLDFDPHLCQTQKSCFDPNRCTVLLGTSGVPQCYCTGDFVGHACDVQNCTKKPCLNGGHCVADDGLCRCKTGFNGTHCEVEANRCLPNPCAHGICDQVGGSTFCDCFTGWTGETCNVSLFDSRFANVPGAFAASAPQPTDLAPLISPALFWVIISICVVLIVVLLVITKFLISGIRKKQRMTSSDGQQSLPVNASADDQLMCTPVDCNHRLLTHLARHPINNLNDDDLDEPTVIGVKQLPKEIDLETDSEACSRLLGASPSTPCPSKFDSNNFFNPNLNVEKVLPAKHILSFASRAEIQNHANAARLSSVPSMPTNTTPLPVRCPSPPNWNAPLSAISVHTPRLLVSARQSLPNAYDLSASYHQDTVAEASAYRAIGNNNTLR